MPIKLKLGGSVLAADAASCITYVDYVESLDDMDAVSVRLDLPSGVDVKKVLAGAKIGQTFELEYPDGDAALKITGDIIEMSYSWSTGGTWRVVIRGLESLHRLRGDVPPVVWDTPPSDYLSTIASRHSLSAEAEGVGGSVKLALQSQNDANFVHDVAARLNYFVRVDGKKLKFGRRHTKTGSPVQVKFPAAVESLVLDVSLFDPVTKVTVAGEDYTKAPPEVIKFDASKSDLVNISGGKNAAALAEAAFGARVVVLPFLGSSEQKVVEAYAVGEMQRRAESLVSGKLRCDAASGAMSGKLIELKDAPWPACGPFLIRQTRRVYDEGIYFVEVDFVSDSLPKEA